VLGLALALINAGIQDGGTVAESILAAGLRGAVLSAAFLGVRAVYGLVRQREGMGLGDVKLAAVAGAWLDCATIPLCVEIAAFSALTIYLLRQLTNGGPIRAMTRVPFGLFFAPAIWLSWLIEQLLLRS
jgi:leader peptidase (prepilin peptidase)/N-methyltransferase